MKPHYFRAAFLLALLQAGSALAQSSEEEEFALVYGDKESISIATGSEQPLRRAPSVATVITAEEIAAMGAQDLDEVLETVPGIHVSRASIRYASSYIFRGIYTGQTNPQVLLMQNGIPMTTSYTGDKGYAWVGVPVENIARIEIIRGPGSALYGANAYAGVINIITKTAADTPGTKFGLRDGSFNSRNAWVQHGGQWGKMDVAAYLNIGSTDGSKGIITQDAGRLHGATLAPGPVNTGYNSIDASLNLAYDKWRLRTAYKLRNDLGTGAGISSALDPNSLGRAEDLTGDLSWNDPGFARNWSVGAMATVHYYASTQPNNLLLFPPGTHIGATTFPNGLIGGPNSWDRQFGLSGTATYSGFDHHTLRLGMGHDDSDLYRTQTIKNYLLNANGVPVSPGPVMDYSLIQPFLTPHRRQVDNLYVQDEWNFARDWTLTAGVRHDRYSDFGGTTNPRLALVWDTTLNLTSKLLYGQAFRAPSFGELYNINPVANGNASLKPETIRTLEAAFDWQARKDTQLNLSFFHYQMHDVIRLVNNTAPTPGSTYQNTGHQHGDGVELETLWDATRNLRLTGNYSLQKSIDEATGQDVGYAPHQQLYLRADWRYSSGWLASTQVNRVMDRVRAVGDTRPPVPDYTTLDLTVRSPSRGPWNVSASVLNLLNTTVLEPSLPGTTALNVPIPNDLPMAPRSLWLQLTYAP